MVNMSAWNSLTSYIKASVDELKKVDWPTREETIRYSIIVIITVGVAVGFLALIDYGLNILIDLIIVK